MKSSLLESSGISEAPVNQTLGDSFNLTHSQFTQ